MNSSLSLVPTQLYVGSAGQCTQHVAKVLKQIFCAQQGQQSSFGRLTGYCSCAQCQMLAARQHPFVIWLQPEREYKLDDLDIIFQRTALMLEQGQRFFFVFESVQLLTLATANRLLKLLEEPPPGYYFLLCASNEQVVLPTIKSRALVMHLGPEQGGQLHPLLPFFLQPEKNNDVFAFETLLKEQKNSPAQATEFAQLLLEQLGLRLRAVYSKKDVVSTGDGNNLSAAIACVQDALKRPPQAGGADLFLKLLYLRYPMA